MHTPPRKHTVNVLLQINVALLYRHNWIEGSGLEISKQPWGARAHCERCVPQLHGLFI